MILVTGATGTVGSILVGELAERADVRVLLRSEEAAARHRSQGVDAVVGAFEDRDALERAVRGVERLFLLSPPGADDMVRAQVPVVDAALAAGVRHVVKLSSIAADEPTDARIIAAHREIERHIEAAGLSWTHLRPHWFMQNELGQAQSVLREAAFHAPDIGHVSMIDARDVGAVAAHVLTEPGHEHRAYTLTGPARITYREVAQTYSRILDRTIRWEEVSLAQARESMLEGGLPEVLATGFTDIQARYRQGGVTAEISPDAERLLGRPPRSFEQFVRDHQELFGAAPITA